MAHGRFRLGQPPEIDQRLAEAAPGERQVGRLLQGMAQQTLRIVAAADGERDRRQTAQRRHVAGIALQDVAKDLLRRLAILRHERGVASSMRRRCGSASRARS